jgi:hypothetical protein
MTPHRPAADSGAPGFGFRWRRLGHWSFLACVAVLALNDHLLKDRYPGLVTGKISDFVGVAMVATMVSVIVRPNIALRLTALGFTALKTVPGVAEWASPLLGGVTRRDPSDLIALSSLMVVRRQLIRNRAGDEPRPHTTVGGRLDGARAAVASIIPIVGALTAVVATTATSCSPNPAVTVVTARGATLYRRSGPHHYLATRDRAVRWRHARCSRCAGAFATHG